MKDFSEKILFKTPTRWKTITNITTDQEFAGLLTFCRVCCGLWFCCAVKLLLLGNLVGLLWCLGVTWYIYNLYHFEGYQDTQVGYLLAFSIVSVVFGRDSAMFLTFACALRLLTSDKMVRWFTSDARPVEFLVLKNGYIWKLTSDDIALGEIRKLEEVPDAFKTNLCGWNALFEEPTVAQRYLGQDGDGRMSSKIINVLLDRGLVTIWTPDGKVVSRGKSMEVCYNSIEIYISNGHVFTIVPDLIKSSSNTVERTLLDDVDRYPPMGAVLPRPLPRRVDKNPTRDALFYETESLRALVTQDTPLGRMAECALIAGLEELDILNSLMSKPPFDGLNNREIGRIYLTNPRWRVYHCGARRWIGKRGHVNTEELDENEANPILGQNTLMWDGYSFVHVCWRNGQIKEIFDEEGMTVISPSHLLYMEDLPYRRGQAFIHRFKFVKQSVHRCSVVLEEGVPSCGKTTNICNRSTVDDIITLPSRAGAAEYVERGKSAKTLDSIVVAGWDNRNRINTMWVDEGLLTHCGHIEMAIQIIKPLEVRVFGDRKQIPFICRVNNYKLTHAEYPWTDDPLIHNKAYKNPKVVCDLLRPLYPNGYIWANETYGSLNLVSITSVESVAIGHTVYLTYTQAEKMTLLKEKVGLNVMTIHEAQGLRFENTAIVRIKVNDLTIYNSIAHNIVAVSRTWNHLTYYTVRKGDLLSEWMLNGEAGKYKERDKEEKMVCLPYFEKGGAYTPCLDKVVEFNKIEKGSLYEEWEEKIQSVIPHFQPESLRFVLRQPIKSWIEWDKNPGAVSSVETIQVTYDGIFPRRDDDVAIVERINWPPQWPNGMLLDMIRSSRKPALEPRPAIHPKLKTTQPPRALNHQLDLARAFEKRVVDPPRQKLDYAPERANQLADGFLRNVDIEYMNTLNVTMPLDTVEIDVLWFNTRGERKQRAMIDCDIERLSGSRYYVIVRSDHKPPLDGRIMEGVPGGQLVTAMHPFWNSVFAAQFQTMLIKVLAILKPNVIFNTRMTWEELGATIDNLLSGVSFKAFELDVSKYDKSQEAVWLDAQCIVFKLLGMCDQMIDLWRVLHEMCILTAPKFGATYRVGYQRRSGDALTWFGNTLVLLMMMAYLYPIEEAHMVLLGGDDNVTCFPIEMEIRDQSDVAAEQLNFELKPLCMNDSIYFSSRFILLTRFGWTTVQDPIKLLTRLGRNDLQGDEHLKEIWNSWQALHYMYLDNEVRTKLNEAAVNRYNRTVGAELTTIMPIIDTISGMLHDYEELKKFYYGSQEEWALTLDPEEKVGGGLYEKLHDVFVYV